MTIRRFRDLSEAIVARATLEAASIPCFLRNEHTVRIDWQISNAIGGIRLDVLESDIDTAEAALSPTGEQEETESDTAQLSLPDVCPKCGSSDIHRKHRWGGLALASILTLGIPLPRCQKQWTCDACGSRWIKEERE